MLRKLKFKPKRQNVEILSTNTRQKEYVSIRVKIDGITWHMLRNLAKKLHRPIEDVFFEALKKGKLRSEQALLDGGVCE
jgi:hypothetical protein